MNREICDITNCEERVTHVLKTTLLDIADELDLVEGYETFFCAKHHIQYNNAGHISSTFKKLNSKK